MKMGDTDGAEINDNKTSIEDRNRIIFSWNTSFHQST